MTVASSTEAQKAASGFDQKRTRGISRPPLRQQLDVLHALFLHDIKSRFFGNGIGYVITIMWASVHMAVIMAVFVGSGRTVPFGDSALLYVATAVLPYICWNYLSRFCMLGYLMNKTFLQYTVIKHLDLIIARILLELVSCAIMTIGMLFVLGFVFQVDVMPIRPTQALLGLLSAIYLGIGFGVLGTAICMVFPIFNVIYVILLIAYWIIAGVGINPELLPTEVGDLISWLCPLLHSTEWVRSSYYNDYPVRLMSKSYVLLVATTSLCLGLILERLFRLHAK